MHVCNFYKLQVIKEITIFAAPTWCTQVLLALGDLVPDASGCDCTDYGVTHVTLTANETGHEFMHTMCR
jgi:hypothetical protein